MYLATSYIPPPLGVVNVCTHSKTCTHVRHVLKDLLLFATKKSHFVLDGDYYDQIDGVAMGSPLGPVLADIFMRNFEEKLVANVDSRPSIWFRYVDDLSVVRRCSFHY